MFVYIDPTVCLEIQTKERRPEENRPPLRGPGLVDPAGAVGE